MDYKVKVFVSRVGEAVTFRTPMLKNYTNSDAKTPFRLDRILSFYAQSRRNLSHLFLARKIDHHQIIRRSTERIWLVLSRWK